MPRAGQRKDAEACRRHTVKSYFTESELAQLRAAADLAGLTLAAYVRATALGGRPKARPSRANSELVRQLAAIGNNLNQLARHANEGRVPARESLERTLAQLVDVLERLA